MKLNITFQNLYGSIESYKTAISKSQEVTFEHSIKYYFKIPTNSVGTGNKDRVL